MQTSSASTDADIRTDRRRHTHRPTQTYAPTDADDKRAETARKKYSLQYVINTERLRLLNIKTSPKHIK
ncbi:hypothetical protein [Leyella stercorea]|uniref:hypothetical protein n=1 Tax=Leyella stercorea TaxID=363265 RepID=UPI00241DDF70|nr:hypothetical protein [Leyella stercorea]